MHGVLGMRSSSAVGLFVAVGAALAVCAGAAGCDGSETTTSTGGGGTGGTTTSSGGGGTGGGGGAGGSPVKPADCEALPIDGVVLVSQQQDTFDTSGSVPIVRTPGSLANIAGDAAAFDRLRILFDGDIAAGTHALDGDPNHALPTFVKTFVPTCAACAVFQQDLEGDAYAKTFVAVGGELEITDIVTPHQTKGRVRHVELREVALDEEDSMYSFVEGGQCYWLEEVSYDVRRKGGCRPFVEGACPGDRFCMPTNAVGTDGVCVSGGSRLVGEACTRLDDEGWDSDCELGLRCIDFGGGETCYQVCDIFSATHGCPAGTHCGGGYNLCIDEADLVQSGIDPAALGEACADATAFYCGGAGQPGACWDDDGTGPMASECSPFVSAPSQCAAPKTAGYVAYKGGIDQSTLFCLTAGAQ